MSDDMSMRRTSFHAYFPLVFSPSASTRFPERYKFRKFHLGNKTRRKRRRSMHIVSSFLARLDGRSAVQHGWFGRYKKLPMPPFHTALPIGLAICIVSGHRDVARRNFRQHRPIGQGFAFHSRV